MATPRYLPHVGGLEYVVHFSARALANLGHGICLVAGEPRLDKPNFETENGVRVLRWPTSKYHAPKFAGKFLEVVKKLAEEVDVVHIHNIHSAFVYYAWKASRRRKIVVSPHYHGGGHEALAKFLWIFWRRIAKSIISSADLVHAASEYEAELIRKHFRREAVVVEHGVDEDISRAEWRPRGYLLYAGRIERYKNIDKAAEVARELGMEIYIVGEGPYLKKLLRRLRARYKHFPFQPRRKYVEILSEASAVINLSKYEAYSLLVHEASAIGVPAIAARPWGLHFSNRPKVLLVEPRARPDAIARYAREFLERARGEPKAKVATWPEVVRHYLGKLY